MKTLLPNFMAKNDDGSVSLLELEWRGKAAEIWFGVGVAEEFGVGERAGNRLRYAVCDQPDLFRSVVLTATEQAETEKYRNDGDGFHLVRVTAPFQEEAGSAEGIA
jgi:hypothetical protein